MSERRRSSEERNAEVRATLVPLAPGERPAALLIAIGLLAAFALANLVAFAAGVEVDGRKPGVVEFLLFEALALAGVVGMWQRRYGAVLAFEVILGVTVAIAALSLLVASNLAALALCAVTLLVGGWLFWKLVRVMSRLRTPRDSG